MWKKEGFYFEQPDVRFRNELLIEVLTEDTVMGLESNFYSTVKDINALSMNELGTPLIRHASDDINADGLTDVVNLHLEIKSLIGRSLKLGESIRNIKIYGSIDYKLKQMVKLEMIGLFQLNVDTPSGAARIQSIGELDLTQANAVHVDSAKRTIYNTNPFDDYQHYSMQ